MRLSIPSRLTFCFIACPKEFSFWFILVLWKRISDVMHSYQENSLLFNLVSRTSILLERIIIKCFKNSLLFYERILKMQAFIGLKSISVHGLDINEITDCLKPAGISLTSIHQLLKNSANQCVCSIALVSKIICMILKIDQDLLLTVQTSFVYLLRWGF